MWLCGMHACCAALKNPKRSVHRLLVTEKLWEQFRHDKRAKVGLASYKELDDLIKVDAPHQGIILEVEPLAPVPLEYLSSRGEKSVVIIVDQVTDPRNIGAIFRAAAAFGADAIITQVCHSPAESTIMAKAASGALEFIPMIHVTNISRALEQLKDWGYWTYGFDCQGQVDLHKVSFTSKAVMIMGAEGAGIRPLIKKGCDFLVRIDIASVQSLNVSMSAGIALYHYSTCVKR